MGSQWDLRDWNIRRGMLLTAALLSVTVAAAIILPIYVVFVIAFLLVVLALLPFRRRVIPFFCATVVLLGLWRGALYRIYTVEPIRQSIGMVDTIFGAVEERPSSGTTFTVRVTKSNHLPANSRILLYCADELAPSLNDSVTATVEYRDLYRTQRYRRADGIMLQAFPTSFDENCVVSSSGQGLSWRTALRPIRDRLSMALVGLLNADEGGLLVAVCLGDRSMVVDAITETFRAAGLSHLLAVSGLHMSVIAGGIMLLMRMLRIKRSVGNVVSAIVILLFVWIVEFTPSVTRAGVMYLTVIVGQLSRYRSDSLNSLGLALTIILFVSPSSIYDIGLWLSFTAAVGILCITPRILRVLIAPFQRLPRVCCIPVRWIINSLSISVGCTLPLMPLLLLAFGEMSIVSPVANLFAVLPAGWMTILGCAGALLTLIPVVGFVGNGLILLAGLLAKWLIVVSECCSRIPGALLRPTDMWVTVLIAGSGILISVAIVRCSWRHVCCLLSALLCAFVIALPISRLVQADAVTVAIAGDRYGSVVVAEHDSKGVVIMNDAASMYSASMMLEDLRVSQPQLVIVANCRTQHEAYLAEWKRRYPSVEIISAAEIGQPQLFDDTIAVSDKLRFWGDCVLDITSDNHWLLSLSDTRLLIGLSKWTRWEMPTPATDAVLLYESSVRDGVTFSSDAVFCVTDEDDKTTVDAQNGLFFINNEDPMYLVTDGDGVWRRLWRSMYVLE